MRSVNLWRFKRELEATRDTLKVISEINISRMNESTNRAGIIECNVYLNNPSSVIKILLSRRVIRYSRSDISIFRPRQLVSSKSKTAESLLFLRLFLLIRINIRNLRERSLECSHGHGETSKNCGPSVTTRGDYPICKEEPSKVDLPNRRVVKQSIVGGGREAVIMVPGGAVSRVESRCQRLQDRTESRRTGF